MAQSRGTLGAWARARYGGLSAVFWSEEGWGRIQCDRLDGVARLVLLAEGNCCPAQLDGSHQDFFRSQPSPWDFSVGRYDLLHTISCQPCDSYIVPGLVCLQVRVFQLSLFLTEDCLEVTMKTELPFFEGYFEIVCSEDAVYDVDK